MCKYMDGVFALCVVDTRSKRITIARDTYGVRPMFTFTTETGKIGLCSEAKGGTSLTSALFKAPFSF